MAINRTFMVFVFLLLNRFFCSCCDRKKWVKMKFEMGKSENDMQSQLGVKCHLIVLFPLLEESSTFNRTLGNFVTVDNRIKKLPYRQFMIELLLWVFDSKTHIQWNWVHGLEKVEVHVDGLGCCCCCCSFRHYRLASVCLYFVLFVYVIVEWKDSTRPTTKTLPMPMTTTHSLDESAEIIFILAKVASHQCNKKKRYGEENAMLK